MPEGNCPRCTDGILLKVAENDDGYTTKCFNCGDQQSIPHGESPGRGSTEDTPPPEDPPGEPQAEQPPPQ